MRWGIGWSGRAGPDPPDLPDLPDAPDPNGEGSYEIPTLASVHGGFRGALGVQHRQDDRDPAARDVRLRDGTSVTGALVSSSPTEVEVLGDDQVSRRIPMGQVRSIDYGEGATRCKCPPTAASSLRTKIQK